MLLSRFLMATNTSPSTSLFGSCGPPFTFQARCRAFRSCAANYLLCTKVRLPSKMMSQPFIDIRPNSQLGYLFCRHFSDEAVNQSSIRSLSVFGFSTHSMPTCMPFSRLTSKHDKHTFEAFSRRMFSTKVMPKTGSGITNPSKSTLIEDGSNRPMSSLFSKNRKRVKPLAAQGSTDSKQMNAFPHQLKNTTRGSQASAQASGSSVNSSQTSEADEKKKVKPKKSTKSDPASSNLEHKKASTTKKQSRNRNKKEELSNIVPSSDIVPTKGSKRGKDVNGKLPENAVNSSSLNVIKGEDELSLSPEIPKKRTSKPKKKGKPLNRVEEKISGTLREVEEDVKPAPSRRISPQKAKPPIVNGIKSMQLKPLYPPVGKSVVVVESQTKAKVIQGYLGGMYEVIPSFGHVRDLASRSGSVRPDDDFSMVWEVPSSAWTHLKSMKVAMSGADNLILASDPDREGEAIAWHIIEMLRQQDALHEKVTIARVVFQEITESAIKNALKTPRDIDVNLVHAYLARRALDYLIGFNISPLLWRKLPGCQSAGRVQSAALSLVCDRELEIEEFKPQEYWTVKATFTSSNESSLLNSSSFQSYLTHFSSKKLNQLSIGSETEAKDIERVVTSSQFKVTGTKRTTINKNPPTPYITSTLQQDAANKLNFSAAYTMKLAQKLYEGIQFSDGEAAGLITYMRTDGLHISREAMENICSLVVERYGSRFAASSPRKFFKKVKNAQEAHEAIRPTDIRILPSMLVGALDEDSLKLYTLIWARTMACQMEAAKIAQLQIDIGNNDGSIIFRAAGSTVDFPGYRSVYKDVETRSIKDPENEANDHYELHKILDTLKKGEPLRFGNVELKEHHTQPPPRYSEASLVKKMEELGIGRPSTYASTLRVLQDRKYVTAKSRVLYPEFRGRMVSAFLSHYFTEVTDYSFTADMETELDNVSGGSTDWKGLLEDYWSRFSTYCERASKLHIHQVEKMLERIYGNFLFSSLPYESRRCPSCFEGTLIFKVSRFGAGYFIGCDQHPKCKFIAKTLYGEEDDDEAPQNNSIVEEPKLLGVHPVSGEKVLLKSGPYSSYVQLGEDRKGHSPKRASLSQIKDVSSVTLEDALDLLRYPVTLGTHPVDRLPVVIKLAKLGFTIRHRRFSVLMPKNLHPNDLTMEKALELLSGKDVKKCGRPSGKNKQKDENIDDGEMQPY